MIYNIGIDFQLCGHLYGAFYDLGFRYLYWLSQHTKIDCFAKVPQAISSRFCLAYGSSYDIFQFEGEVMLSIFLT